MTARVTASAALALACLASIATPRPVWGKSSEAPPSSIGHDPRSWTSQDGWHLRLGIPMRDTLGTNSRVALLASRIALENDHWECERPQDGGGPHLTTHWKALHNLIVRLFTGRAFGRCFVFVRPLPGDQVEITFQGGLAARRDIEHTPIKGFAERSYRSAARDWQREVRALVTDRLSGSGRRGR